MPPKETTAAVPWEETPRSTRLPLSRVKRLIGLDNDINQCSQPGAFLITQATELFIQHLATSTHTVVRSERKPRKNIAYKDLATAVARNDQLEFLSDVVPKTVTYKEAKARKGKPSAGEEKGGKQTKLVKGFEVVIEQKRNGESSANGGNGHSNRDGRQIEESENIEDADLEVEPQNESESRRERLSLTNGDGILNGKPDEDGDVQMQ